jgi:HEPN domain-containing protein
LKGVLVATSIDFPRVHDIRQLLGMLASRGVTIPQAVQQAEVLTPYAVQTRYPADFPDIAEDELEEAQAAAEATVAWAEAEISSRSASTRRESQSSHARDVDQSERDS